MKKSTAIGALIVVLVISFCSFLFFHFTSAPNPSLDEKKNLEAIRHYTLPVTDSGQLSFSEKHPILSKTNGVFISTLSPQEAEKLYSQDIYAVYGGTVTEVHTQYEPGTGYGMYLVISHENGYQSLYGHCSKILVEEGDQVSSGEKIAEIGSTGATDKAGCYFEISRFHVPVSLDTFFNKS